MRLTLDPAVKEATGGGAAAVATTSTTSAQATVQQKSDPAPAAAAAAPAQAASTQPEAAKAKEEPAKAPWLAVGDQKPAATAPAADPAKKDEEPKKEEKFDLKVPEGHAMEAAALEAFGARMKALGVSQEQAQKLLAQDLEVQKAQNDRVLAQINDQDVAWEKELRTAWGEKYGETGEKLKRVYDYIDPQGELRKGLEAMRMAHNPVLNKALAKLIPLFEEPKLKAPSSTGVVEKDTRTPQERVAASYREQLAKGVTATPIPMGIKVTK